MCKCKNLSFVPNLISLSRIILTAVFAFYILHKEIDIAFVAFVIAAITDFLDGRIARFLKVESVFGSILDPLADKCFMITSYFVLGWLEVIPPILSAIVIFRDIAILLVVCLCKFLSIHLEFKPLFSSKLNTTIQLIYVIIILACWSFSVDVPSIILYGCALVVGVSTIFSAVEYVRNYYWIKNAICTRK